MQTKAGVDKWRCIRTTNRALTLPITSSAAVMRSEWWLKWHDRGYRWPLSGKGMSSSAKTRKIKFSSHVERSPCCSAYLLHWDTSLDKDSLNNCHKIRGESCCKWMSFQYDLRALSSAVKCIHLCDVQQSTESQVPLSAQTTINAFNLSRVNASKRFQRLLALKAALQCARFSSKRNGIS